MDVHQMIEQVYAKEAVIPSLIIFGDPGDPNRMFLSGRVVREDWLKQLAIAAVFSEIGRPATEKEAAEIGCFIRHFLYRDSVGRDDGGRYAVQPDSRLHKRMMAEFTVDQINTAALEFLKGRGFAKLGTVIYEPLGIRLYWAARHLNFVSRDDFAGLRTMLED